jgi:thioredoxin 1
MSNLLTLTDTTLDDVLDGEKPVLLLFSDGAGVRSDFRTAFNKASDEHPDIVFAEINPQAAPKAAARFDVGTKPIIVGWAGGESLARRVRPWGSDVPLTVDMLKAHAPPPSIPSKPNNQESPNVYNEPVNVTDETFQQEVIESDLPVLVDFWAEWCGPCRMVAPILDKLAKEYEGKIKIAKVDVDANPGLSQNFQIRSIPNMMAIKDKTIVFNQPGALPEPALRDLVDQLIDLEVPAKEEAPSESE